MEDAHYNKKGKYVGRTSTGIAKDRKFKAMGAGERVSKKTALITKKDGTRFRRKNANQHYPDGIEGGNEYYEGRPDRSDASYKKGSTIKSKAKKANKDPEVIYTQFEEESYGYKKGGNAGSSNCEYTIGGL